MENLQKLHKLKTYAALYVTLHIIYITRPVRAIKEMGYEILKTEELIHALFGGVSSEVTSHNCYRVYLENPDKSYTCHFEALD